MLHISDDEGNNSDFIVKKDERGLLFSNKDVTNIIDACIAVIEDSLKHGEKINIHGFGSFAINYRASRKTKHPVTGEDVVVEARYVPKFTFGNAMRMAAKVYEMSLKDNVGDNNVD